MRCTPHKVLECFESLCGMITASMFQCELFHDIEYKPLTCYNSKKVAECLRENEPEEVERRKGRKLQHRRIYIAGVNVSWSMDQHDKWRKYGLYLHTCVEVCSGYILWMKVWWTNRNPRVICSYYLDAVRERGGMCYPVLISLC